MAREFVRDPATGKPAVQIINYEVVELDTLQAAVDAAQAEFDQANQAHVDATNRLSEAESRLNDSKSELEVGQAITAESGTDGGSETVGGEDSSSTEESPGFVQDV